MIGKIQMADKSRDFKLVASSSEFRLVIYVLSTVYNDTWLRQIAHAE